MTKTPLCLCIALLLGACNSAPVTAPVSTAEAAREHARKAGEYSLQNRREQALHELDLAIRLDASDADYVARRGHIHAEQGDTEPALHDINQALRINPDHAKANFDRAMILYVRNELPAALNDIERALRADPNSARILGARCIIGAATGEAEAALSYCNRALAQPQGRESAYVALGQAYLELKRPKEALDAFESALKIAPRLARALYGQGLAKQKLGDKNGEADMRAALQGLPGAAREFRL